MEDKTKAKQAQKIVELQQEVEALKAYFAILHKKLMILLRKKIKKQRQA
jgi:hypothetical protein